MVPQASFKGLRDFDRMTVPVRELQALRIILMQLANVDPRPTHIATDWIRRTVLPTVRWAIGTETEIEPSFEAILDQGSETTCFGRRCRPSSRRNGAAC